MLFPELFFQLGCKHARRVWNNFIVLEGLDGAGTTTQLHALSARFQEKQKSVFVTCEPTEGRIGTIIRQALRKEIILSPTAAGPFVRRRQG
jgi:dTMP kinase